MAQVGPEVRMENFREQEKTLVSDIDKERTEKTCVVVLFNFLFQEVETSSASSHNTGCMLLVHHTGSEINKKSIARVRIHIRMEDLN